MKIGKFVASMLPSFEKTRILEDVNLLKTELRETTLPPYQEAVLHFGNKKFNSKVCQNYDRELQGIVKSKTRGNYINIVEKILADVDKSFDEIESLIDKNFAKDVSASGMTYLKANLIQYIEALSFMTRYSRKLLSWTLHEELKAVDSSTMIVDPFTKATKEWFWNNRLNYFKCLKIIELVKGNLKARLSVIPDMVIVPEEVDYIESSVGISKTDPLQMGLIPLAMNPIYHVRMTVAEWQVNRHKEAQEELRSLQYRLLALKEANSGKKDAKLEQAIEYTEGRVQKLNRKISEMEEDLNG
jgi:hypothetical protein